MPYWQLLGSRLASGMMIGRPYRGWMNCIELQPAQNLADTKFLWLSDQFSKAEMQVIGRAFRRSPTWQVPQ